MPSNRKTIQPAIRLGPALKVFLLCSFLCSSGVGYVWQKNQIHQLGKEVKAAELTLDRYRAENHRLSIQWNSLRSPALLESRIRELNLDLSPPAPHQIVRLAEPDAHQLSSRQGGGDFSERFNAQAKNR